jgi:hypothetical protein
MPLRLLPGLLVLSLLFGAVTGAARAESDPEPLPTFRAGAELALGVTIHAPAFWVINPGVPFRVTFDKEQLKKAGLSIDKAVQDFTLKNYVGKIYIELPLKLSNGLPDGEVSIPFQIDCGICTADQESCTFSSGTASVRVIIENKPQPGSKLSALKKGVSPGEFHLSLP